MTKLARGLYERLITEDLEEALEALDPQLQARRSKLHPEEAADRLALYLASLVRRAVSSLDSSKRTELGVHLAGKVVELLAAESKGVEPPRESRRLVGVSHAAMASSRVC